MGCYTDIVAPSSFLFVEEITTFMQELRYKFTGHSRLATPRLARGTCAVLQRRYYHTNFIHSVPVVRRDPQQTKGESLLEMMENSGRRTVDGGQSSKPSKEVEKTSEASWDNLPVHLLSCIIPHFSYLEDHMALSSICKSWRKFIISEKKPPLPPRSPVLMLVKKVGYEHEIGKYHENLATRNLKSKLNIRICKVKLPAPAFIRCMGTNFGWVLTVDMDLQISLLYPFSGDHKIQLPPNPSLQDLPNPEHRLFNDRIFDFHSDEPKYMSLLIRKAAVSSTPGSSDFIVMGIFTRLGILAFSRPQDSSWTKIELPSVSEDVIYYKGKFYSVDVTGKLFVCDTDGVNPRARRITPALQTEYYTFKHLVGSAGDIFLVVTKLHMTTKRYLNGGVNQPQWPTYNSNELAVFKLAKIGNDEGVDRWDWERVFDLGNAAFLVGASTSVSLTVSAGTNGCYKGNHIYMTDDAAVSGFKHSLTVVDMENTTVEGYELNRLYKSLPFAPFFYM